MLLSSGNYWNWKPECSVAVYILTSIDSVNCVHWMQARRHLPALIIPLHAAVLERITYIDPMTTNLVKCRYSYSSVVCIALCIMQLSHYTNLLDSFKII